LWGCCWIPVQVSEKLAGHRITLAGYVFQAIAMQDPDVAAAIFDQSAALQGPRNDRDRRTPCAEHLAEELLRQGQIRQSKAILDHEQPSRQPFFNFVNAIASRKLTEDESFILHLLQDSPMQHRIFPKRLLELPELNAHAGSIDLHEASS
jgi:hypothetical protein